MRLRLEIAYDGTDFSGWAVQPGRRTVAGVLGEALDTLFRQPVAMVVAGRTDAGVHATGQVAHIDVEPARLAALAPRHLAGSAASAQSAALVGLRRRLAGLLPPDVRVPLVRLAPDGFDARFAALRRHYRYRIVCADWGAPPLARLDVLARRRALDGAAMARASVPLLGLHDFAAYCKPRDGATTVRDLQRLDVTATALAFGPDPRPGNSSAVRAYPVGHATTDELLLGRDPDGVVIDIDAAADAFCHSMVRSLVGALIAVGEHRFAEGRPAELLAAGERTAQIAVAPARGLTLVRVDYPPDAELASRAAVTRAVRESPSDCAD